jgi:protein TonB
MFNLKPIVMKVRKNPKVNLENKRRIFFQIGMILALIAVFAAFEYRSYDKYELPDFNVNILL